jgi:hypothetical protein
VCGALYTANRLSAHTKTKQHKQALKIYQKHGRLATTTVAQGSSATDTGYEEEEDGEHFPFIPHTATPYPEPDEPRMTPPDIVADEIDAGLLFGNEKPMLWSTRRLLAIFRKANIQQWAEDAIIRLLQDERFTTADLPVSGDALRRMEKQCIPRVPRYSYRDDKTGQLIEYNSMIHTIAMAIFYFEDL